MTGNCHVRCGVGEKVEIASKPYLSLFGRILDFKKTISVVRGYGINCLVVVQSIAQLADRYPIKEWEEIVGNCDTQLFLGCNDTMTSEFISKRCGNITIQLTNSMAPQTPLFSPITREVTGYRQTRSNNTRPLMYPEEVLQLDNRDCLLLIRGQKPLKACKIIPDELSAYSELEYTRVSEYVPQWHSVEEHENAYDEHKEEYKYEPVKSETPKSPASEKVKENDIPKQTKVKISVDESEIYDPDNLDGFTETDADDILNG